MDHDLPDLKVNWVNRLMMTNRALSFMIELKLFFWITLLKVASLSGATFFMIISG